MLAIFKRDFRSFFTSPLGYIVCAAFTFITYFLFYLLNIAINPVSDVSALFNLLVAILMLGVPLLTMKLLSDEARLKTDQLLLTSPVSVVEIVVGKYFAAMGVVAIAMIATLGVPLILSMFGEPAVWQIAANYIMLILGIATFVSIGLFVSSLTESQVIAAVLSYVIIFALFLVDFFVGIIYIPIIQDIIGWFSIFSRFSNITNGMLSLADIVYFLSIIVVFLFLTTRVLEKKRWA